ncbi:vWA domain-containing protein [Piscinibacter sakaiensis]|uniref:Carbon monoxide oxidation accessory protein CoxE n=1 Tax=Piscinibacter sakaiensis TaxID=1547922 RepID=A0A0K8P3X6_PISS1|nr:VWA domain-containing protein [Piscinibacter sakaiensis]GAP36935.1 carbon monoxide oxidation accessory protein CoxE [Piscinibacter sakaiensis]
MLIGENLVHFARILRRAGMPVGPDRVLAATAALEQVGVARREDVHAALSAVMLDRHEQQTVFDAAFEAFWRDPKLLEQLMYALLPKVSGRGEKQRPPRANRLAEALSAPRAPAPPNPANQTAEEQHEFDARFTFSDRERLQRADFETMTAAEFALAQQLAERLPLPVEPVRRRRRERAPDARDGGRIDLRATLLRSARQPHTLQPAYARPRREPPTLVVLLDISGSMERYARLFLHYVHGLTRRWLKVHTLTFGTRLTNVTRSLRHRDPDVALAHADGLVADWKGGTRIASCLDEFNHRWARRLLGGNAALLLVTDGLDRDTHGELSRSAAQLRRLAHQIVWLNPLLRFDGFEPRAAGVRALLPHVDHFLPVHNLASLADLGRALRAGTQPAAALRRAR